VDPQPAPGRAVTSVAAGMLASVAVLAAIGSLVPWPRLDVLGPVAATRMETHRSNAFERIGRWPLVRRIPVSASASARAGRAGVRWDPRTVVGAKVVAFAATMAVFGGVLGPVALPIAFVAWRVPDLVLARMARRTTRAADREIPVLLDLLAVATSAGLPPQLAFRRAVEGAEGPLADALREVVDATDLGGRWRDELKAAGDRLELADLRRLIGALTRTEAVGSSLSEEVSRLAADVREVRRATAAQRARTAPVRMLFPLVFLVLPAFLLLTVVPVLLTTVRSIA
jgi:Flp pilus assembly protein TadB